MAEVVGAWPSLSIIDALPQVAAIVLDIALVISQYFVKATLMPLQVVIAGKPLLGSRAVCDVTSMRLFMPLCMLATTLSACWRVHSSGWTNLSSDLFLTAWPHPGQINLDGLEETCSLETLGTLDCWVAGQCCMLAGIGV